MRQRAEADMRKKVVGERIIIWTYLSYPDDGPALDLGILSRHGLDISRDFSGDAWRRVLLEEGAEALLLLLGVGREQLDGAGLAGEPVGHEDLVLLGVVGGRQDVGALQRLRVEPEDVENADYALGGVLRAGNV